MAHRMAEDLEDARVVIFDKLHHLAPLENPDHVNAELLSFLMDDGNGAK